MGYGKVPAAESEGKAAIHGKCGTSGLYGTERGEAMLQGPLATLSGYVSVSFAAYLM